MLQLELLDDKMLAQSVDLFMETFSKEPWNDKYESRDQVVQFFERHMSNNYYVGYVALIGTDVVGISIGAQKPYLEGMEYYIDQFCISDKYQGKGLGTRFLELIAADIKKDHMNAIILTTSKGFPSEKFYAKNGFESDSNAVLMGKRI